ncbi:MAG TPA: glycoside hydrolase family 38 C-terminal domain-containing protein [Mycobacteriales bacterium]|nr:glycoside hydrolase family 38 C-terminal domain-containing protein [Mycobacteriales bacterium]
MTSDHDDVASTQPAPRVLHMIGNAHIDPVWLWQWPEGYQEARATLWSAVQRMDEYDDFVFTCDQVVLLSWIEESDPELFELIRRRVADGRFILAGGWWVEPDCNIPCGESFARQGLLGQRYLQEKFGKLAAVGMNVDPFGHHAMLPQILRKHRLTGYCFLRPGPHEMQLPGSPFAWESPDGSRVTAYRIPHEYCAPGADLAYHTAKAVGQFSPGTTDAMVFYGVGNHGGGPTRANLDNIHKLNDMGTFGRLVLADPGRFFDSLDAAELPVWAGELQHHAAGCYSAHSAIKRWNRRAENALLFAEKWAVVAARVADVAYPAAELTHAWKQVLFNQFHDLLPGTSIEPAYDDARDQLGEATSIARRVGNRALQNVARKIVVPFAAETQPVLVFNAHPWPVRADVEVELSLPTDRSVVRDSDGREVPTQPTQPRATMSDRRRQRLVFPADIPPLGYRLYSIGADTGGNVAPVRATDTTLENDHLQIEVDPATGWLTRLVHKQQGVDLVAGAARPHCLAAEDQTDTWGHFVVSYSGGGEPFRCSSVRLVEQGPVRAVLRIESRYGSSSLVEELILGRDAEHLEIRLTLDWHEQLTLAKLRFPTALTEPVATFEIPYGDIVRPTDGAEQPGQSWVDVTGTLPDGSRAGLTVLNNAKSAYDVRDGDIGITIARSPVYAWHDPRKLDADGIYSYQDQGRQSFSCLLVPHAGDRSAADVVRRAAELNQPPQVMFESFHPGQLGPIGSFAAGTDPSVVVTAIKGGEDDSAAMVVRAYESAGQPCRATIDLPLAGRTIEADFSPHEIKTFLVPADPAAAVQETDLLEWPQTAD